MFGLEILAVVLILGGGGFAWKTGILGKMLAAGAASGNDWADKLLDPVKMEKLQIGKLQDYVKLLASRKGDVEGELQTAIDNRDLKDKQIQQLEEAAQATPLACPGDTAALLAAGADVAKAENERATLEGIIITVAESVKNVHTAYLNAVKVLEKRRNELPAMAAKQIEGKAYQLESEINAFNQQNGLEGDNMAKVRLTTNIARAKANQGRLEPRKAAVAQYTENQAALAVLARLGLDKHVPAPTPVLDAIVAGQKDVKQLTASSAVPLTAATVQEQVSVPIEAKHNQ